MAIIVYTSIMDHTICKSGVDRLVQLPDEIVEHIVLFCKDDYTRFVLRRVNIKFNELIPKGTFAIKRRHTTFYKTLVLRAHEHEPINLLKWFEDEHFKITSSAYNFTAKGNKVETIQWLYDKNVKLTKWAFVMAAFHANLDTMKLLKQIKCPWDADVTAAAASNGHLDGFTWLCENGCNVTTTSWRCALQYGRLDILKYIWKKRATDAWRYGAIKYAAKYGHLYVIQWLVEINCYRDINACYEAAKSGHVHVLEWLYDNGFHLSLSVYNNAVQCNDISVIEWFHQMPRTFGDIYTVQHELCMIELVKLNENLQRIIAGEVY